MNTENTSLAAGKTQTRGTAKIVPDCGDRNLLTRLDDILELAPGPDYVDLDIIFLQNLLIYVSPLAAPRTC